MAITLTGYADTDKVPGFYSERIFGAGQINIRTIPLVMLCCGLASSAGTITPDVDVVEITGVDAANTYAGRGSELGRMLNAAIAEARGYRLMACAPTGAGGSVASATVTYATNASSAGYWYYYCAGIKIAVPVASGDTPTTQASAFVTACSKLPDLPFTVTSNLGVATLVIRQASIRGNQWILYQDKATKPGGTTSTLAGGSAVTSTTNVNGIYFSSGAGVETMTTMLGVLQPGLYDRCAWAQNDATSLAAIAAQCDAKAGPLEGRSEHNVVAANGTSGAAISLAQTTLNNVRFQLCHMFEAETHPSEIAAAMCAKRASVEQSRPQSGYDGYAFTVPTSATVGGVQPHRFPSQTPTRTVQQTQLDAGVTPIKTESGKAKVVRAITTHCLNGTTPDYRTIDVHQAWVPDYMATVFMLRWTTQFVLANPNVQDNPGDADPLPPSGVAYPALWNAELVTMLRDEEAKGTICQVSDNLPESEWNAAAGRIMSRVPVIPTPLQHSIGVLVQQLNAA